MQVVVNGPWHPDALDGAFLDELVQPTERTVPSDNDNTVDTEPFQAFLRFFQISLLVESV